jgi:protein-L-isoaspartate(D-aspartate) O-methyltransferase
MNRSSDEDDYTALRHRMVEEQLRSRGIEDERVLEAMERVPRHAFVPPGLREMAYSDNPLPIGEDQTISQPYVVAVMTEALAVEPGDRVLEIGTGSGYQAAILAEMGVEVFTVEYHEKLSASARRILERLDYADIHYRIGDGRAGWPEEAPFAGIIVTAAPDTLPQSLADQLKSGGRLVIPIGRWEQDLFVCTRQPNGTLEHERLFAVRFVPLV